MLRIDWLSVRDLEGANLGIEFFLEYCGALHWSLTQVVEVRLDVVLRLDGGRTVHMVEGVLWKIAARTFGYETAAFTTIQPPFAWISKREETRVR